MRNLIIIISTILASAFLNSTFAQIDSSGILKIKKYIHFIDSLIENDNRQKLIIQSISEGTIEQETTFKPIAHNGEKDSTRIFKKGGFGKYTIENIAGDTLYCIKYHDNLEKNFYELYYFKDNKLIYSKVELQDNGMGNILYFKKEYYDNDKVITSEESQKEIGWYDKNRVSFSFWDKGNEYLREFLQKK